MSVVVRVEQGHITNVEKLMFQANFANMKRMHLLMGFLKFIQKIRLMRFEFDYIFEQNTNL